jgi:hypothetical protein
MAKQEQILIIEPQHELKFRGKIESVRISLSLIYINELVCNSLWIGPKDRSSVSSVEGNGQIFTKVGTGFESQGLFPISWTEDIWLSN